VRSWVISNGPIDITEVRGNLMEHEDIIRRLIEIGRSDSGIDDLVPLRDIIEDLGINRKSPQFWIRQCQELTVDDVVSLFRGLVVAEKSLKLSGGSVSGTIWIFKYLDQMISPRTMYELANWAISINTFNTYCPLGGRKLLNIHLLQGKTLSGMGQSYLHSLEMAAIIADNQRRSLREEAELKEKMEREREREHEFVSHMTRSKDQREVFRSEIDIITRLSQIQRLDHLVKSKLPVNAFPKDLFDLEIIRRDYSGEPPIEVLHDRLRTHKGHWAKLLKILEDSQS
jgi:hypothetical protein